MSNETLLLSQTSASGLLVSKKCDISAYRFDQTQVKEFLAACTNSKKALSFLAGRGGTPFGCVSTVFVTTEEDAVSLPEPA